jgi:hypothetical protein
MKTSMKGPGQSIDDRENGERTNTCEGIAIVLSQSLRVVMGFLFQAGGAPLTAL